MSIIFTKPKRKKSTGSLRWHKKQRKRKYECQTIVHGRVTFFKFKIFKLKEGDPPERQRMKIFLIGV